MEVIIDGQRNFELKGAPENLMEVLAAITEHLRSRNRGMVILEVDGEQIPPEQVNERLADRSLSNVRQIEVRSEELRPMVEQCLVRLQQVLPDLPRACRDLAKVFHGDSPDEGYEPFHKLAQIWSEIKEQERLVVHALELDLEAMRVGTESARDMHTQLNQFLEEAAEAMKNGDTVLLGDLLEYELAPRAEQEAALVALLQERATALSG